MDQSFEEYFKVKSFFRGPCYKLDFKQIRLNSKLSALNEGSNTKYKFSDWNNNDDITIAETEEAQKNCISNSF